MQGVHTFRPEAEVAVSLEAFIASDHLLRKVDRVLELAFVRDLTAQCYSQTGRPSVDPEVFFRMLLIAYLYGIPSDRRLCEEVRYNMAYRWFCRLSLKDAVPNHSSLSRIRDRYGEQVFETCFRQIVLLCKHKGLVAEECRIMTDASLIPADASLDSLVHNDPEEAKKEGNPRRFRKNRRLSNQTHSSYTDPEATLVQKRKTPLQLNYKVHQSIDADSRVILDAEVTTGAKHDNQPYLEQLQRICDQNQIAIRETIADRGYGSATMIRTLQNRGIKTYIPLWSSRVGNSKYLKSSLIYEKENDRFRCPEGKYLTPIQP